MKLSRPTRTSAGNSRRYMCQSLTPPIPGSLDLTDLTKRTMNSSMARLRSSDRMENTAQGGLSRGGTARQLYHNGTESRETLPVRHLHDKNAYLCTL